MDESLIGMWDHCGDGERPGDAKWWKTIERVKVEAYNNNVLYGVCGSKPPLSHLMKMLTATNVIAFREGAPNVWHHDVA